MRPLVLRLCSRPGINRIHCQSKARSYSSYIPNVLKRLIPKLLSKDARTASSCDVQVLASTSASASRMDITKATFGAEAVRLLQDVAESHFIAFDFEFSGIAERNRDRGSKQTVEERYEETRASVQEYQPLQIGLTVVKFDEENSRYVLEPYNFNISPLPLLRERQFSRKWSMHSGAISFLQRNGFDFGRQIVHGVPYLSRQEEDRARAKMAADARPEEMVLKVEDQVLVNHVRQSVAKWQSLPKEEQEDYLNIPNGKPRGIPEDLNGYQRRLVHQIVQKEFPAMKSHGMGHFIQITNPTVEQAASQKCLEEEIRELDLSRAIGLRWILDGIIGNDLSNLPSDYLLPALPKNIDAAEGEKPVKALLERLNVSLRERRKVLVGHNCLVDLLFLYKITVGDLPATLEEFKDKIRDMFPAIIDTKYISSCFSEKHGRLTLGEVEQDLRLEAGGPLMYTSGEFDRYTSSMWLHEAGYDSYITAIVAIKMAAKLQKGGSSRKKDHERQQLEVVRASSSSPLDFGVQEGYETARESQESLSEVSAVPTPKTPLPSPRRSLGRGKTDSVASFASNTSTDFNGSTPSSSPVAVKERVASDGQAKPVDGEHVSPVAALRSAFASTGIYDALADSVMPGDETPETNTPPEDPKARMDRLVKEGKLMPRWAEEGAFWEVYGNKLQVNGTVEGVLKLVD